MKCPVCEENIWIANYRPDVNIISLHCANCNSIIIELDATQMTADYNLNNKIE